MKIYIFYLVSILETKCFFVHNFCSIFPDILVIKEMHPPVPVDSIHLSSLVRITISSLFTCYQRHNLGVFQSHAINATTRVSSNPMLSTPPTGYLPFTCYQRHNPDIFPSNDINATTQIPSLQMLSTPQPGCLPIICCQRRHPVCFPSHAINAKTRVSSLRCFQRCQHVFFPSHAIKATTRVSLLRHV